MGLTWNFSAVVATIALLAVFGAIWAKMKAKKDSPIYKLLKRFRRKKSEEEMNNNEIQYRRISHRGGIKY